VRVRPNTSGFPDHGSVFLLIDMDFSFSGDASGAAAPKGRSSIEAEGWLCKRPGFPIQELSHERAASPAFVCTSSRGWGDGRRTGRLLLEGHPREGSRPEPYISSETDRGRHGPAAFFH